MEERKEHYINTELGYVPEGSARHILATRGILMHGGLEKEMSEEDAQATLDRIKSVKSLVRQRWKYMSPELF